MRRCANNIRRRKNNPPQPCNISQMNVYQKCILCGETHDVSEVLTACPSCGGLLDVQYDWDKLPIPKSLKEFEKKWAQRSIPTSFSGVWRFYELLPFVSLDKCKTIGEGQTVLQTADKIAPFVGMNPGCLRLQYEGLNPSGSFKDNGMTAALTHANLVGATTAACASTGNTSASLALYASLTGLKAVVFVGSGKIAYGKLSQALDYGALTLQVDGDFDDAMARVREVCPQMGIYLVNSVNPFRLEGQKTIMYRVLESLNWQVPDWIVVPGGNLGNSSSFGKAFHELKELGLIDRIPRLAVINAHGANTLYQMYEKQGARWNGGKPNRPLIEGFFKKMNDENRRASTIASAIEINRPVNFDKCLRALEWCDGVVREVSDEEILNAKAQVGKGGLGCEPASAASVAGAKLLREEGVIAPSDNVVCILTGHLLKDPTATVAYHSGQKKYHDEFLAPRGIENIDWANNPIPVANDTEAIIQAISLNS